MTCKHITRHQSLLHSLRSLRGMSLRSTPWHGVMYIKPMKSATIFLVTLFLMQPELSFGQAGCNSAGFIYRNDIIKITNFSCVPRGLCSVAVELPRHIEKAKFVGMTLHYGENEDTKFFVNVAVRKHENIYRAQVLGTREYLENLDLRVTYSAKGSCALYGKTQLIHNKKQNAAYGSSDATSSRPFVGRYVYP